MVIQTITSVHDHRGIRGATHQVVAGAPPPDTRVDHEVGKVGVSLGLRHPQYLRSTFAVEATLQKSFDAIRMLDVLGHEFRTLASHGFKRDPQDIAAEAALELGVSDGHCLGDGQQERFSDGGHGDEVSVRGEQDELYGSGTGWTHFQATVYFDAHRARVFQ